MEPLSTAALRDLLERKAPPGVAAMMSDAEATIYCLYHNDFLYTIQQKGYTTLADYARQHGYLHDQVMTFKNLLALLTLRHQKAHKQKHKHMRLRYLEEMFTICVRDRNALRWQQKVEQMEYFKKKNKAEKSARKEKQKIGKKIDESFPLFSDQLKAEENARIEKEKQQKLQG
jgi:hypothetical protein